VWGLWASVCWVYVMFECFTWHASSSLSSFVERKFFEVKTQFQFLSTVHVICRDISIFRLMVLSSSKPSIIPPAHQESCVWWIYMIVKVRYELFFFLLWNINFLSGRHHKVKMRFCNCEKRAATLLKHGLWPARPVSPNAAYHIDFLMVRLSQLWLLSIVYINIYIYMYIIYYLYTWIYTVIH
jgi:hypothetical protein